MSEKRGHELIAKTERLNKDYKILLQKCGSDPSQVNWENAYNAHIKWVESVNELKEHNSALLIDIRKQFIFK